MPPHSNAMVTHMAEFDPQASDPQKANAGTAETAPPAADSTDADVPPRGTSAPVDKGQEHHEDETVLIGSKRHKKRTVFYVTAVVIALLLFGASVMTPLVAVLKYILSVLSPLIIGAVIAYLCDPILEFYEYRVFRRMKKGGGRRGLSLFLTVLTALGIVGLIGVMMIPQLYKSLSELFTNYREYLDNILVNIQEWIDRTPFEIDISNTDKFIAFLGQMFGTAENSMAEFFNKFQEMAADANFLEKFWAFFLGLLNSFKNLFIGIFIAFYLLASKEKRVAQVRKFRRAMFSEKTDGRIQEISELANRTFGGFIYGKILDSAVIGLLTFVLLSIFNVSPYNLLIATFVGVTNIIPVFGPFIGAIPSFFVVLISNPSKAFLFLILILIIQQLDGNFIGPKILGDNTGVSSLCVIIAIAICSSLWGVAGMLIGVPIFAVIIELIKRMLENRLEAKGEPTDTLHYYPDDAIGNAEKDVYYEHASLRYRYEHSKFKVKFEKFRRRFYRIGRDAVVSEPPTTTSEPADSDNDQPTQEPAPDQTTEDPATTEDTASVGSDTSD